LNSITHDYNRIFQAFDQGVQIHVLEGHAIFSAAAAEIRSNKATVDVIETLTDIQFNNFLADSKVYTFESVSGNGIDTVLFGLSSMDGTRSYLRKSLLKAAEQKSPRIVLEHEMMHNISRWGKNDPRKISPKKNSKLVIGDRMVEAGDFYQHSVYGEIILDPSPFCLTEFKRKSF
jgi:hypothetical protein